MIRFGPFRLDPANRNLTLGGRVVPLRPKTFALLEHLASNPGRLLTKEELLDAVWPDTVVGDATLKASIKEIRQALGDDAAAPRYVETAHRLGYRFVAAVEQPKVPTAMSRFIGREREVAEVRALVGRSRLVTLTGAGGSGKTRLALEALGGIAVDFDDGPWWVDLAGVSTPSLVDQAVAAILEVREHGGRPVAETVAAAIGARRALLVLDNCEHVVAAVATLVVHLLRDCPRLGILATSREALGIEGELSWLVPPLSLPGDDDALASEAVRLFLDRAATVRGRFEPSAAELGAVARIARHLDGIPLAIELAAARLKVLSLFDIVERLDDCFTLLGGGGRRAARHQTLRATMDWSHALLSAEEQALFRRIGVFVAGFSLAAAEAVGPGGIVQAGAVLDLLARLVERSLVIVEETETGTRYRLLEPIRQYAESKLGEAGETETIERRHAEYFLSIIAGTAPDLTTGRRDGAVERLRSEIGNLRRALRFALAARDGELAARLAGGLVWFWFHDGSWGEGRTWLDEVLAAVPAGAATRAVAASHFGAGLLAWTQGHHPRAEESLGKAVALARDAGDDALLGYALHFLGAARLALGDAAHAPAPAEESVAIFRGLPTEGFGLAGSLVTLGIIRMAEGDYEGGEALFEQSAATCRAFGDRWTLALPLRNLAIVAARRNDFERAAGHLRASLEALRERPEKWFVSRSLETLASVLARQGRVGDAARLYGAGEVIREAIGAAVLPFYRLDYDAGLDALRSALRAEELRALWEEGRRLGMAEAIGLALGTG